MTVTREIHLDPEAEQILASISEFYDGDTDRALSDVLKSTESMSSMVSEIEGANAVELTRMRERAEQQLASGDTVSWDEVKRRKGL